MTAYLDAHWDGQPILMSMGSLGHYMHDLSAAGFGVKDFLHEGNGEIWKYAVAHPAPVVEWIAIEERAEGGDALQLAGDERRATSCAVTHAWLKAGASRCIDEGSEVLTVLTVPGF